MPSANERLPACTGRFPVCFREVVRRFFFATDAGMNGSVRDYAGESSERDSLLPALRRRETAAQNILRDGAGEEEILQVVPAAGFRAAAAHFEAAEGVPLDDCARDAAVEVQVADEQFVFGAFESARTAGEQSAGEGVFAGVGDRERFIEIAG